MILLNGGKDNIEWTHIGVTGILEAGEVKEFDNARANHITNKFGKRGILQMAYGDDEVVKRAKGLELWEEFWEDQITKFNQHNEDQKEKGNRYAKPPRFLSEKAKELNLDLLQPWKIKTKESNELKELRESKNDQAKSISMLTEQVGNLTRLLESSMGKTEPETPKKGRPPIKN